ncbi:hypothetical protein B0H14DRAFT_2595794 [Mycena olivaceomarginata]|nr:hypothetical protein B0H14DRAFT_2595794 [Mycena olivaceomarginata]
MDARVPRVVLGRLWSPRRRRRAAEAICVYLPSHGSATETCVGGTNSKRAVIGTMTEGQTGKVQVCQKDSWLCRGLCKRFLRAIPRLPCRTRESGNSRYSEVPETRKLAGTTPGDSPLSNEEGCTGTTEGWDNPPLKVLQDLSTDGSLHSDRTGRKVRPLEIEVVHTKRASELGLRESPLKVRWKRRTEPRQKCPGVWTFNIRTPGHYLPWEPVQEGILEGRRLEGRTPETLEVLARKFRHQEIEWPWEHVRKELPKAGRLRGGARKLRQRETLGNLPSGTHQADAGRLWGIPPSRSNGTERRNRKCPGFQMKTSESSAARPWKRVRRTVPALHRKVNDKVSEWMGKGKERNDLNLEVHAGNNEKIPGLPPGGVVE